MKPLPSNPNLEQLKRQAKDLLSDVHNGAPDALSRVTATLGQADAAELRLHDAQFCIAREYGFASWAALKDFVEMARARRADPAKLAADFARLAYSGGIADGMDQPQPEKAARFVLLLKDRGPLDPWIACAAGEVAVVEDALRIDPAWHAVPGGPLNLPPLVAATQSSLIRLPDHRRGILDTVALLLSAGADPNQSVGSRWPPASVAAPSSHPLSALYGAAGANHDVEMTRMLLDAGADPNDGESLYHSLESGNADIVQLLLDAGAVVEGTNALYHALDFDDLSTFQTLLANARTVDAPSMGPLLHWAINRRRSTAHVQAILDAGGHTEGAYILALRHGLPDVAVVLERAGLGADVSAADRFVAACVQADAPHARQLQAQHPEFPAALNAEQLQMFPKLAEAGCSDAVRLMADLGWPLDLRGGDWDATALNHAVFRGDASLVEALLKRGSQWTETHGFDDNACGTLSWASLNRPQPNGDWVGCAAALVAHGMPGARRDPAHPETVLVGGERRMFSDDVTAFLLSVATGP